MYYEGNNELYHHGILGQRWGKRNGPPYPLDEEDHSKGEKKAGWKKSLDAGSDAKKPTVKVKRKETKNTTINAFGKQVIIMGMKYCPLFFFAFAYKTGPIIGRKIMLCI